MTKKLAEYLKNYNSFVYILPNYLDPELFSKYIPKPKNKDGRIIIGYTGSATHSKDFEIVTPAINQILKEFNGKVIFHSIGFLPEDFKEHSCAEFLGYFDYKNYIKNIGSAFFDIGLGPLEDNLFNQCKSNVKFLEYGIYSIPGVWSNVLPYTEVVDDGKDGILVKHHNADSWYKTIKSLIYNPELRKRLSVNLKEKIKKYQLPQHIEKWYEVYTSLINKDRQKSEESYEVCRKFMQDFLQIKKGIYNISRVKRYDERILKFLPKTSLLLPVQELCKAYIYEMRGIRYLKHNLFKAEKYLIQAEDLLNNLQITK